MHTYVYIYIYMTYIYIYTYTHICSLGPAPGEPARALAAAHDITNV